MMVPPISRSRLVQLEIGKRDPDPRCRFHERYKRGDTITKPDPGSTQNIYVSYTEHKLAMIFRVWLCVLYLALPGFFIPAPNNPARGIRGVPGVVLLRGI